MNSFKGETKFGECVSWETPLSGQSSFSIEVNSLLVSPDADKAGRFRLQVSIQGETGRNVWFTFSNVFSYRMIDECFWDAQLFSDFNGMSDLSKHPDGCQKSESHASFIKSRTQKVVNSLWAKEGAGLIGSKLEHYLFLGGTEVLEVLAETAPEILTEALEGR